MTWTVHPSGVRTFDVDGTTLASVVERIPGEWIGKANADREPCYRGSDPDAACEAAERAARENAK